MLVCDRVEFQFYHLVVAVDDDGDDMTVYCSCCLDNADDDEMIVNNNCCKICFGNDFDAIEKDDAAGNNTNYCGSDLKKLLMLLSFCAAADLALVRNVARRCCCYWQRCYSSIEACVDFGSDRMQSRLMQVVPEQWRMHWHILEQLWQSSVGSYLAVNLCPHHLKRPMIQWNQ